MKIHAVDMFCGVGGMSYGLKEAGIFVDFGVDLSIDCKGPYERAVGAPVINRNISEITDKEFIEVFSRNYDQKQVVRLLAGCPPCQTFSSLARKKNISDTDERWFLLDQFLRLIVAAKPELIALENVRGMAKTDIFKNFLKKLQSIGYHVSYEVVNCADHSVPQNRHRLLLLGSLLGEISLPEKAASNKKTVRDSIGNLPPLLAGQTCMEDPMHRTQKLSKLNLERIRASRQGGTWREWPEELILECHKKLVRRRGYGDAGGRMSWDAPSPTITTSFYGYGSGRFGHPEQDRAISLREGALLQGFPIDYPFLETNGSLPSITKFGRLIGNAVPPIVSNIIGKTIVKHVEKYCGQVDLCPSSKKS